MSAWFGKARAKHLRLGETGEKIAARMFRNAGCDILMRDCRTARGEIDLIIRDGLSLIFAEVKTRRAGSPERLSRIHNLIRPEQKRRIYRAAFAYLQEIGNPAVPFRFDYIEVLFVKKRLYAIRHWPGYFGCRTSAGAQTPSGRVNLFR